MRIDNGQRRTAGTAYRAGYCDYYTGRQAKCQGTSSTPSLGKERVSCGSLRIGTETLWRKLKYKWLQPEDYADEDMLRLAVCTTLKAVGTTLKINFSPYKNGLKTA